MRKKHFKIGEACPVCKNPTEYSVRWDAIFCPECNFWLEKECNHEYPECHFGCVNRPEKPLQNND